MLKKILQLFIIIAILLETPGCWSRKEPKNLSIINSALYDRLDNGIFQVTLEIQNPSPGGSGSGGGGGGSGGGASAPPHYIVTSDGVTISEAVRNSSESLENVLFGEHNKIRFISERFAKTDMFSIMDFILRDHLTDETPLFVIIKGDNPRKIYSVNLGKPEMIGDYIDKISDSQPKSISKSVFVTNLDFIKDIYTDGKQPVAGAVSIIESDETEGGSQGSSNGQTDKTESEKKYKIKYEGLAGFKNNKLVGYLDGDETVIYNLLTNKIKTAIISVPYKDGYTALQITNSKADIKTKFKDGRVSADIKIKADLSVVQESGSVNVNAIDGAKETEKAADKQMEYEIEKTIRRVQNEFKSDIFGFGKSFHIQNPKDWKQIKGDWDDYFSIANINVAVDTEIKRSGELTKPFKTEE